MDFIKALRSAEELIYLVGTWLILLPKTIVKVFWSVEWTLRYVNTELEKESEDRYKDYMSPIMFWILLAVIPYVAIINHYFSLSQNEADQIFAAVQFETKVFIFSLSLIGIPIGFSFFHQMFQRAPVNRDSLQPMFLTQCYIVTFFLLTILPYVIWGFTLDSSQNVPALVEYRHVVFVSGLAWLMQAEVRIVKHELRTTLVKSIARVLLYATLLLLGNCALLFGMLWLMMKLYG